ncbi:hypothetical protein [Aureicoccus marinus]|uniref:Uncharacterized protein n=1 Tax=Aureicoccus marinus TaxID=754435 RepID=A0A2S7T7N7_9FLAO|nr:hypothetical protein [Aureicoccus marinus]PQJ15939.1 hypothetical protein BST99_09570 [Aureicoccus marinus]
MKTTKVLFWLLALVFVACETENLEDALNTESTELESTVDAVNLEVAVEESLNVLDDIAMYSSYFHGINDLTFSKDDDQEWRGRSGFFRECSDFSIVKEGNTLTITIVFNGECEDENGNVITGTIVKVESYNEGSSENSLTVTDLAINGYLINGSRSYSHTRSNENGNPEMSGNFDLTVVTEAGTVSKAGSRKVEITEGADTETWVDNVKTITGFSTYTTLDGATFSVEITTPLVKPAACKFIVSGVKTYTTPTGTSTLDFGDGTCDGFALYTNEAGEQMEVVLGKKRRDHDDDDDDDEDDDEDEDEDEDDDEDDEDDSDEDDSDDEDGNDEAGSVRCVLITPCTEKVFEDEGELYVVSEQTDNGLMIWVKNMDDEVIYEEVCQEEGEVSLECSSESDEEGN